MKVEIHRIAPEDEEFAALHTNRQDDSLERLKNYIESEDYHTVLLQVKKDDILCMVPSTVIYYIESIHEVQYIHAQDAVYTSRERLYRLLGDLPRFFVRASKSMIINLQQVKYYKPLSGGLMLAEFSNGDAAYISRKYVPEIRGSLRNVLHAKDIV